MNELLSIQELIGSVNGLKQTVESTKLSLIYISSSNNCNLSSYHDMFNKLIIKYSGFAEEYKNELNVFHKLLLNKSYKLQQEQLEIISNCSNKACNDNNNEIIDNSDIDDSSAAAAPISVESMIQTTNDEEYNDHDDSSSSDQNILHQQEQEQQQEPAKPVKPVKAAKIEKSKPKKKNNGKSQQNKVKKVKKVKKEEKKEESFNNDLNEYKYKYDEDNIDFGSKFDENGEMRTSTLIFIGNLPSNITKSAIKYFIIKKCKITMRHIEEVSIKNGKKKGCYSLVRIRCDVSIEKINKFINDINYNNNKEFEDNKNGKNGKNNNNKKVSWQRKVYLNLNNTFKYFEDEYSMFNDPNAKCTLFVRNFDILNKECHKELTYKFLEFGQLKNDIIIKTDYYDDPYLIVTFNDINDSIYCCNSEIKFYGRTLELKYDGYSKQ